MHNNSTAFIIARIFWNLPRNFIRCHNFTRNVKCGTTLRYFRGQGRTQNIQFSAEAVKLQINYFVSALNAVEMLEFVRKLNSQRFPTKCIVWKTSASVAKEMSRFALMLHWLRQMYRKIFSSARFTGCSSLDHRLGFTQRILGFITTAVACITFFSTLSFFSRFLEHGFCKN